MPAATGAAREPGELGEHRRAPPPGRRALQPLGNLAIPGRERLVFLLARLLEPAHDVGTRHVLDLVDLEQRRLSARLLDLLRQPLELLEVLGRERQDVDGLLQRHGAERPELPPHPDPHARRVRRQGDQEDQPLRHQLHRNVTYVT